MKNRGFTLVESMTVLTLIGVALAIMAPSLLGGLRRTTTRAAMDQFISAHALARSMAVRYGRLAALHIDPSADRYWIEVDTATGLTTAMDTVGRVRSLSEDGVDLASDRSVLCFDARGFPSTRDSCESPAATLVFSSAERSDTLRISSFGKAER